MINASKVWSEFKAQHSKWIAVVGWLFVFSVIFGAMAAYQYPEVMNEISEQFNNEFGEEPALDAELAKDIFVRNLTASLIAWLGGLVLGIMPFIVVLVNGLIIGYVVGYIFLTSPDKFAGLLFPAAGLIPHGILELPAFLVAGVLGMKLGLDWLSEEARGQRWRTLGRSFVSTSKYFLVVVLTLVVAAVIEVFVSGQLVNNFQ